MPITSRQHVSTLLFFFFFQGFLPYIYISCDVIAR